MGPLKDSQSQEAEASIVQELDDAICKAATKKWEHAIVQLERLDDPESEPENSILLIGSSTIRIWESAASDMAPYPVIRRGYGGAKFSDVAFFAERLITPHRFSAMVVFVGNDIASNESADETVTRTEGWVRRILQVAHEHQPGADLLLVEVTPTPRRWGIWHGQRKLNAMLRELALTTPGVYFVATAGHFLDPEGNPRPSLFRPDQLHLNDQGYKLWSSIVLKRLHDVRQLRCDCKCEPPAPHGPRRHASEVSR